MTFELGTDPDTAAVQTQNRVNVALAATSSRSAAAGRHGAQSFERVPDGGDADIDR